MSSSTDTTYFIVDPENRKLVSGEISFTERSQRELLRALFWVVIALATGVVLHLVFGTQTIDLKMWVMISVLMVFWIVCAASQVNAARIDRRLELGQFVDGKIVNSRGYWQNKGRGRSAFALSLTYVFNTPTGIRIEHKITVEREDLWKQAPNRYQGLLASIRRPRIGAELQQLAPKPGTPLKIRYVNDSLFTVM